MFLGMAQSLYFIPSRYGHLTWEWKTLHNTTANHIHSPFYHLQFSLLYSILKATHLDKGIAVVKVFRLIFILSAKAYGPRILSAFWAAIFDFYLCKIIAHLFKPKDKKIAFSSNKIIAVNPLLLLYFTKNSQHLFALFLDFFEILASDQLWNMDLMLCFA